MIRILTGVVLSTVMFALTGFSQVDTTDGSVSEAETASEVVFNPRGMSNLFADISEQVGPSVVTITSTTTVTAPVSPFMPWGFGFGFPGQGGTREYVQEALGSGVIINSDGLIVTNNHVAADSDELKVILSNGDEVHAKLVGADPRTEP